jgi:hypothetical protein
VGLRHSFSGLSVRRAASRRLLPAAGFAAIALIGRGGGTPVGVISLKPTTGHDTSSPTAALLAIDPCALMTQQEASTMAGVALSAGRLTSAECYFSGYTPEASVTLQVSQGPDSVTARAMFNATKDRLSSPWTVTDVPAIDDAAAIVRLDSGGSSLSGIVVLDGSAVFNLVCEQTSCSNVELEAGAKIVAGQLAADKPSA